MCATVSCPLDSNLLFSDSSGVACGRAFVQLFATSHPSPRCFAVASMYFGERTGPHYNRSPPFRIRLDFFSVSRNRTHQSEDAGRLITMRQLGHSRARGRLCDKLYSDNEIQIQVFSPHGVPIYRDTMRQCVFRIATSR